MDVVLRWKWGQWLIGGSWGMQLWMLSEPEAEQSPGASSPPSPTAPQSSGEHALQRRIRLQASAAIHFCHLEGSLTGLLRAEVALL